MLHDLLPSADLAALSRSTYATPEAIAIYARKAAAAELRAWEIAVVERTMGPQSGIRRVLAVGCGAGREVFALEALGFDVAGVDLSAQLIEAARAEAQTRSSAAEFHLTDGAALPFADAAFDAVVMWAQVLGHVPLATARTALLAEIRRVLRTHGALSLSVHDRARTMPLLDPARIVSTDMPEHGDFIITEPDFASTSFMRYFDETELRALITRAGFAIDALAHTDNLGEAWGNVFVAMASVAPTR